MLILFAITSLIYGSSILAIYNSGYMVGERMRVQNAADAAAYCGATWVARCYNYTAYTNRAIIAQLSFMTFLVAVTSHLKAWEKLMELASYVPYVGAIFAGVRAVINVIKTIVETVVDLPTWEAIIYSIVGAQAAMTLMVGAKLLTDMGEVARVYDSSIEVNNGVYAAAHAVNIANAAGVLKLGKWQDLEYVLKETIASWTKGTQTGSIPLYNRGYELFPITILYIPNFGIGGEITVSSNKIKSQDNIYMKYKYISWRGIRTKRYNFPPPFIKERNINLSSIKFQNFKNGNLKSPGIYAVAVKKAGRFTSLARMNIDGMFGVPSTDIKAIAKARAVYDDPQPASSRHQSLSSQNKEPNLWNPFWRAELVSCDTSRDEDLNTTASRALLTGVFGVTGDNAYKKH